VWGSRDLPGGDAAGVEYDDPNLPALVHATGAMPSPLWHVYKFDMHSLSEPTDILANAYIRFKDQFNYDVITDKHPNGITEPEAVDIYSGTLANHLIPGIDPNNDIPLANYVEVILWFDTDNDGVLELVRPTGSTPIHLADLMTTEEFGGWIGLGQIPACHVEQGEIWLRFDDIPESAFGYGDGAGGQGTNGAAIFPTDVPFSDWPTNVFQLDGVSWSLDFALTQEPIPATYLTP
jgi:hypothetical protein